MEDYEILNGKPHLGIFLGNSAIINGDLFLNDPDENSVINQVKQKLSQNIDYTKSLDESFEVRHTQWIVRPAQIYDFFRMNGSIGVKYMIWGRAFKIKKLLKKGVKRYRKKWINGQRKTVRIDRYATKDKNRQSH